jgi:His-Xaa-Ser system protein HxsD
MNRDKSLLSLNTTVYPLSVIYKTAYIFLDRCYVFLDLDNEGNVQVSLELKNNLAISNDVLAGEFSDELLNQVVRFDVYQKTKNVRELILARALYSTCYNQEEGVASGELETNKFDINEIAKDWFSSHGK